MKTTSLTSWSVSCQLSPPLAVTKCQLLDAVNIAEVPHQPWLQYFSVLSHSSWLEVFQLFHYSDASGTLCYFCFCTDWSHKLFLTKYIGKAFTKAVFSIWKWGWGQIWDLSQSSQYDHREVDVSPKTTKMLAIDCFQYSQSKEETNMILMKIPGRNYLFRQGFVLQGHYTE